MLSPKDGAWAQAIADYKESPTGYNLQRVIGWEWRADREKRGHGYTLAANEPFVACKEPWMEMR